MSDAVSAPPPPPAAVASSPPAVGSLPAPTASKGNSKASRTRKKGRKKKKAQEHKQAYYKDGSKSAYPRYGLKAIMKNKTSGGPRHTTKFPVQKQLKFKCDWAVAERICRRNRDKAEDVTANSFCMLCCCFDYSCVHACGVVGWKFECAH